MSESSATSVSGRTERTRSERASLWFIIGIVVILGGVLLWLLVRNMFGPPSGAGTAEPFEVVAVIDGPATGDHPRFERPLAAAFDLDGRIYVADTDNSRLCVFSPSGRFLREITTPPSERSGLAKMMIQPAGIAVADDGSIYVADISAGTVFVFDPSGELTRDIHPEPGETEAKWVPTDVAIVLGKLYVTDETGVAVFETDGTSLGRLEERAEQLALLRPNGVAAGPDDSLIVSDTNAQRVLSVGLDGMMRWSLGPNDAQPFGLPRGLTAARDGSILVADAFKFGISRLSADGEFIQTLGSRGSAPGEFEYPNDVDSFGDLALVADKDNDRVQVLRLNVLDD